MLTFKAVMKEMFRKEILYVSCRDEPIEEGISYALYLAGLMGSGLRIVLLSRNVLAKKFDDLMSAVTFTEANEHETAMQMLAGDRINGDAASIQRYISERCGGEGIRVNVHIGLDASVVVVHDFLNRKKIDLVLLSPAVSESRNILSRLLKRSSRPVVTMSRENRYNTTLVEGRKST